MNYIYQRTTIGNKVQLHYEKGNDVQMAGCINGIIPNRLKEMVSPKQLLPFGWTIPIAKEYNARNLSIIIDIKPKGKELFLCELDAVFGVCYTEWTPIMYRLKRLFEFIADRSTVDENDLEFEISGYENIYTMQYFYGSFVEGKMTGKWIPPARSSANGLLLWPEASSFFFKKINEYDPDFLNADVFELTPR